MCLLAFNVSSMHLQVNSISYRNYQRRGWEVVLSCGGVNVISTLEDLSMFHFSTYRLNITNITFVAGPKCIMSVCFPLNNSFYIYIYVYIWILSFLRLLSVFVKYYRFMGIREERMGEKVTKTWWKERFIIIISL